MDFVISEHFKEMGHHTADRGLGHFQQDGSEDREPQGGVHEILAEELLEKSGEEVAKEAEEEDRVSRITSCGSLQPLQISPAST